MSEREAPLIACDVCQSSAATIHDPVIATKHLDCPKCGKYSISDDFFSFVRADEHWQHVKPLLSFALRWASDRGTPVTLGCGGDVMTAVAAYQIALHQAEE